MVKLFVQQQLQHHELCNHRDIELDSSAFGDGRTNVEIVQESLHASRTTPQFLIEDRCQPCSELHLGSDVEAIWNLDRINGPCSHAQFGTALYDLLELSLGQRIVHPCSAGAGAAGTLPCRIG